MHDLLGLMPISRTRKLTPFLNWVFTRNGQCCRSTQECKEYKRERKLDDWWNMYYALTFLTKKPLRYSFYVLFKSQSILWSLILHGCESRCRLGRPEFLDSDLLCMIDSVYDTSYKNGISFAKEKTSKDKGELKRKKYRIKKWNNFLT